MFLLTKITWRNDPRHYYDMQTCGYSHYHILTIVNATANDKLQPLSESLKALAHPDRLNMLLLIARHKKQRLTVSDIQHQLGLLQPETSRHLNILKSRNILTRVKEGARVFYLISPQCRELVTCVTEFLLENQESR
jgi:ArsR family transcriptional regulator